MKSERSSLSQRTLIYLGFREASDGTTPFDFPWWLYLGVSSVFLVGAALTVAEGSLLWAAFQAALAVLVGIKGITVLRRTR